MVTDTVNGDLPVIGHSVNGDIQVIGRVAHILRRLEPGQRSLRVSSLASELGVGRSTMHRYLTSMANAGLLERVGEGEYVPGPLLAQLGTMALNSLHVVEAAGPVMRSLCDSVQETVVLSIWGGMGPVVTRVETPDKLIQVLVRVGSQLPIDAAQTRVFLAHLEDRRVVDRLLALVPDRREELEKGIVAAQADGMVIMSRIVEGLRAVAVPVMDGTGITASLGVVGTTAAVPDDPHSGIARALTESARFLSEQLGHSAADRAFPEPEQSSNRLGTGSEEAE